MVDTATTASDAAMLPRFPELSIVTLATTVRTDRKILPAGAQGAVVYAYRQGAAYEVEFTKPFHCIAMVSAEQLRQ